MRWNAWRYLGRSSRCWRILVVVLGVAVLYLGLADRCEAVGNASATGRSSWWAASSDRGDDTEWGNATGLGAGTNFWTDGVNIADAKTCAPRTFTEPKFPAGAGNPAFKGFSATCDPGGAGASFTLTSGTGSSGINLLSVYWVKVRVDAGGLQGTGEGAYFYAHANCCDPLFVTPSVFSTLGIAGPAYDLYVSVQVGGQTAGHSGDLDSQFSIRTAYETSLGTTELLRISVDGEQVSVTSDSPSGLGFFLMPDPDMPTTAPANATTLSELQSMLAADLAGDHTIDTPLNIGMFWDNIALPLVDLGDGTVGKIYVEPDALQTETSSEPIPLSLAVVKPGKLAKIVSRGAFTIPDPAITSPLTAGGSLKITGTTGTASYSLDAGGWEALGPNGDASKGFKFRGDPCRVVLVKPTVIKAVCKVDTGTLALPEPGPIDVGLTIGAMRYCARCGGTAKGDPSAILKRKDCTALVACP